MSVRLVDPAKMHAADWPAGSEALQSYAAGFARADSSQLIVNLYTRLMILRTEGIALPVTINETEYDNTYVCSHYTAYARYAKEELRLLPGWPLRKALGALADGMGVLLKAAQINRTVQVNNWMLSTNLFPVREAWPIEAITTTLVANFPQHYLCFRSLNAWDNAELLRNLSAAGYKLVATRQVYVYDRLEQTWTKTANCAHDRRHLRKSGYRVVTNGELGENDYARMAELYGKLYLDKYSRHNPAFTVDYMRLCHAGGVMTFSGLRNAEGRLDGVIGLFIIDGVVTAPIVGYDTSLERKLGLYRLLMTLVFEQALAMGARINLSSGAAHFKTLRGGRPMIEYMAIYDRHLALKRRAVVNGLRALVNGIGVPLMRKLKL